jgi:hypothetical protein
MPYTQFDRSKLKLLPLAERRHDLDRSVFLSPDATPSFTHPSIDILAERIREARKAGAAVLVMIGAHVIRSGAAPCLIRLMQKGYITHIALNGAGAIHDFELALIGATCESVARYVREGQFGLWKEDEQLNETIRAGAHEGLGFGEALGRYLCTLPYAQTSLLAGAYQLGVPATVHVGIGCDIVHELPNADGAAIGLASYRDFLVYTQTVTQLEGGVFLNFGSAVIGPEVYLKALSMARNAAHQEGRVIRHFTTAVMDLLPLEGEDIHTAPDMADPRYYFRPWKTILARTVADGGESYYIQGRHKDTVAALTYALLNEKRI